MDYGNILVNREGPIASIVINRPDTLNALNEKVLTELFAAFNELESDRTVKVVVLTGAGKAFIAGADIKHMSELTPLQARHFAQMGHSLLGRMEDSRLPIIAAVTALPWAGGAR